jgi:hypothetical protein
MIAIALAAAMAAALFAATPAEAADGVQYTDISGNTQYQDNVTEAGQAFFDGLAPRFELNDGWFLVAENVNIIDLVTVGDVSIIIADGCVLTVDQGITVAEGSLCIYSQPPISAAGKLTSGRGHSISLGSGSSFTNTATVSAFGDGNHAVNGNADTSDVRVTNGSTGILEGECGINFTGSSIIVSNTGGLIQGLRAGIQIEGSAYVQNSGTIEGTEDGGIGIYATGTSADPWIDNFNGTIRGPHIGIYYAGTGGGINNYSGTIEGGGHGIYADSSGISFRNVALIKGDVALADRANSVVFVAGSAIEGGFTIGEDPSSVLEFSGDPRPLFQYSTVGGNVCVGAAEVSVEPFEAADMQQSAVIVLIDGSTGTMSGTPANFVLRIGGYEFELSVEDNKLIATLPQTVTPPISVTPPSKEFFITASAGPGAAMSPEGKTTVTAGDSRTFRFSASDGYTLLSVAVDGVSLSAEQVASGSYTFFDVRANHAINVSSRTLRSDITLNIDIAGGKGHAEYSVNGEPFLPYTGTVSLQEFSNIFLRARADTGYQFDKWEEEGTVYETAEIPKYHVGAPVHLELYFDGGDSDGVPLWAAAILLLFAAIGIRLILRSKMSSID